MDETYFSNPAIYYAPYPSDGLIEVDGFLRASTGIANFVGLLGKAFSPVKMDIQGNVDKIRAKQEENRAKYTTLQSIVEAESAENVNGKMGRATDALLWLKRGLQLMCSFLEELVADHRSGAKSENVMPLFQHAYESTLKQHHNWVSRQLVSLCMRAMPWRKDILHMLALGKDGYEDRCIADIERFLIGMRENVNGIVEFYQRKALEKPGA